MRVYEGRGIGDFYYRIFRDIWNDGKDITVRGRHCRELPTPVCLVYEEPGACFMNIPNRKYNVLFAVAEIFWMWSGRGDVEWISYFNSNMKSFQDGNKRDFHGAYGLRTRKWIGPRPNSLSDAESYPLIQVDQIEQVVKKLVLDPFSRQAIISLWDPSRDNLVQSKDYPCNNIIYFSLRDGVLNMSVTIRSNDLLWGTTTNAIQFTHLLAIVSGLLGFELGKLNGSSSPVRPGTITYFIENMHFYLDQADEAREVIRAQAFTTRIDRVDGPGAFKHPLFCTVGPETFRAACRTAFMEETEPWNVRYDFLTEYVLNGGYNHYWVHTLPAILWFFNFIKEKKWDKTTYQASILGSVLGEIGEPFASGIVDFYKGSKNEAAQAVLNAVLPTVH